MSDHSPDTVKGPGLARGGALTVGAVLSVLGLILFFKVSDAPLSSSGFPDAQASGDRVAGFDVNAWTAWSTAAAGALLLFGAAQHLVAKTVSLIVGLALGAASVIALVDGNDVLGLARANGLTALVWGVAAAILLANSLMPRLQRERPTRDASIRDERAYGHAGLEPQADRPREPISSAGAAPGPTRERAASDGSTTSDGTPTDPRRIR